MSNHTDDQEALVCHCFHYTVRDIKEDFVAQGRSTVIERINREMQAGLCFCAKKNPKGR